MRYICGVMLLCAGGDSTLPLEFVFGLISLPLGLLLILLSWPLGAGTAALLSRMNRHMGGVTTTGVLRMLCAAFGVLLMIVGVVGSGSIFMKCSG